VFTPSTTPWATPFDISVFTDDATLVGVYLVQLEVALVSYTVAPALMTFNVNIIQLIDQLPIFSPSLVGSVTIDMPIDS
jgi:hypothetical protein